MVNQTIYLIYFNADYSLKYCFIIFYLPIFPPIKWIVDFYFKVGYKVKRTIVLKWKKEKLFTVFLSATSIFFFGGHQNNIDKINWLFKVIFNLKSDEKVGNKKEIKRIVVRWKQNEMKDNIW